MPEPKTVFFGRMFRQLALAHQRTRHAEQHVAFVPVYGAAVVKPNHDKWRKSSASHAVGMIISEGEKRRRRIRRRGGGGGGERERDTWRGTHVEREGEGEKVILAYVGTHPWFQPIQNAVPALAVPAEQPPPHAMP